MVISSKYRRLFENVGVQALHRVLVTGGAEYIGIDQRVRDEAQEWVEEQRAAGVERESPEGSGKWSLPNNFDLDGYCLSGWRGGGDHWCYSAVPAMT
jgi:hypothetical protein